MWYTVVLVNLKDVAMVVAGVGIDVAGVSGVIVADGVSVYCCCWCAPALVRKPRTPPSL
jgi:hypothetical protein